MPVLLTHWGLVMLYGILDLGQQGSGYGLLLDGTKPLPGPVLTYHQLDLCQHISIRLYSKVLRNAFENVICKIATTLFRSHCVNNKWTQNGMLAVVYITITLKQSLTPLSFRSVGVFFPAVLFHCWVPMNGGVCVPAMALMVHVQKGKQLPAMGN